jgi:NAD(P)H dehydrogenase (quinone)
MTIAVTGANGEFGRSVVEFLAVRTTEPVLATVRDLAKARPLDGVEYRPGDFADPDTLRSSLDGVGTVLVNATFFGADPAPRSRRPPRRESRGSCSPAGPTSTGQPTHRSRTTPNSSSR